MRKNGWVRTFVGKSISIAVMLSALPALACAIPFSATGARPAVTAQGFRAKIPDGVYLYKEHGPDEHFPWFGPIMIVEKGRLVDPYRMTRPAGGRAWLKKLLTGKTFNVFMGSDLVGRLEKTQVGMDVPDSREGRRYFARDIIVGGNYAGPPFKDLYFRTPGYFRYDLDFNFGCASALLAPPSFTPSRKIEFFPVTEEDKARVIQAFRSAFLDTIIKHLEINRRREGRRECASLEEDEDTYLDSLQAFDIDNNGKKDFVGIYTVYARNKKHESEEHCSTPLEILFVLMDTGRIDMLASSPSLPGTALGGAIDIDGDGMLELVIVSDVSRMVISDGDNRQLSIFRHDGSGWKIIYRTVPAYGEIH